MVVYNSDIRVLRYDHSKVVTAHEFTEQKLRMGSCPSDPEISVIGPYEDNTGAHPWQADDAIWNLNLNKVHPDVMQIIFYTNVFSSSHEKSYDGTNIVLKFYYPHQYGLETEYQTYHGWVSNIDEPERNCLFYPENQRDSKGDKG